MTDWVAQPNRYTRLIGRISQLTCGGCTPPLVARILPRPHVQPLLRLRRCIANLPDAASPIRVFEDPLGDIIGTLPVVGTGNILFGHLCNPVRRPHTS